MGFLTQENHRRIFESRCLHPIYIITPCFLPDARFSFLASCQVAVQGETRNRMNSPRSGTPKFSPISLDKPGTRRSIPGRSIDMRGQDDDCPKSPGRGTPSYEVFQAPRQHVIKQWCVKMSREADIDPVDDGVPVLAALITTSPTHITSSSTKIIVCEREYKTFNTTVLAPPAKGESRIACTTQPCIVPIYAARA